MPGLASPTGYPLSDGRQVVVRRVVPADSPLLADGFARLSSESRRLRFLAPKPTLTEQELHYLTEVDGHDHEALVAIDPTSGQGVGIARFVRDERDPSRAEVAVTVVDDWQRQGVGTILLTRLSDRARDEGIERFTALIAEENRPMQDLFRRLGAQARVVAGGVGAIEYEVDIAPKGLGDHLKEALRAAATGELLLPATIRQELRRLVPLQLQRVN